MATTKKQQIVSLTRQQAADRLLSLGRALEDDGDLRIDVDGELLTLPVAERVRLEVEIESHEDSHELEIELKWSNMTVADAGAG